jgi:uncharacterized protein with HEPN domain
MSKRNFTLFLMDAIVALEKVERLVRPFEDAQAFRRSDLHYLAACKLFEIVGEAIRYLVDEPLLQGAKAASWRGALALRNVIVHEYFALNFEELFKIAKQEVPGLLKEFEKLCLELKAHPAMRQALEDTKYDLVQTWNKESAEYIQKIITKLYA